MTKIDKIGNLAFYAERNEDESISIIAVNGTDIVAHAVCFGGTVRKTINSMLRTQFDIVTIHYILYCVVDPVFEHDNRLISGRFAVSSSTEYFKRIDSTDYYKHFTQRPRM